jgi:hypothetical protein
MAVDYTEMMQSGRHDDTAAARAPVVSFERVKPKRLTKKSKQVLLKKRNAEKKTMAKKKRTAKQIAATKKLVRLNKKRAQGKKGGRKTVRVRNRGARAVAAVAAREPASRAIVLYGAPGTTQKVKMKKPKRAKKKSGKSGSASRKGERKSRRTAAQRAATRKMIAANRGRSSGKSPKRKKSKKRKSAKRSSSRRRPTRGKRRARAVITVSASERRGRRRRRGRRHGALENPLSGVELFIGTLTGLAGFGTADVVDRIIATHSLTATTVGTMTTYTDVPPTSNPAQGTKATYGSLFNATAVCAPMDWKRWLAGLAIAGFPIWIGHYIPAPVGRSSLQFFGFGALMRVAGKGLIDMTAALTKSNKTGMQLYAGEQRAAAVYANDGSAGSLPMQSPTGLGRPALAPPMMKMGGHQSNCGCGACKNVPTGTGYPSMPAPQMTQAPAPPVQATVPVAPPATVPNTNDQNIAIRGIPKYIPRYNWGHKAA